MRSITVRFSAKKALTAAGLAVVLGGSTYAFTAGNTIGAARAGDGASAISGYNVSGVAYVTDPSVPTDIDAVTFTLDANATTVKAKVVAAATAYTTCANTAGNSWTCDFTPNVPVTTADQLAVVATE